MNFSLYLICFIPLFLTSDMSWDGARAIFTVLAVIMALSLVGFPVAFFVFRWARRQPWVERVKLVPELLDIAIQGMTFGGWRKATLVFGITFVNGLLWIFALQLVGWTFGMETNFLVLGLLGMSIELIRLVPITVQGIGVRESFFAYFFGIMGLAPELGFLVGLVSYAALSVSLLIAGGLGAVLPARGTAAAEMEDDDVSSALGAGQG